MLATMVLTGGDYAALAGLIVTSLTVPVTMVVLNLRTLTRRIEQVETRVHAIEESKVSHGNWVRIVATQQNRQNRMSEQLAELSGKLDATIGIAGGLKRIGQALERQAKT